MPDALILRSPAAPVRPVPPFHGVGSGPATPGPFPRLGHGIDARAAARLVERMPP